MKSLSTIHPSETDLIECALDPESFKNKETNEHVDMCQQCADYIGDIKKIAHTIEDLPDITAPVSLKTKIEKNIAKKSIRWKGLSDFTIADIAHSPIVWLLGIIGLILFLYLYVVYLT